MIQVHHGILTGQNYIPTKIFSYLFHIKPLIFITFSWSHSLADFHEIFTFNSRIIRVYKLKLLDDKPRWNKPDKRDIQAAYSKLRLQRDYTTG
jgi:hypothetical protein